MIELIDHAPDVNVSPAEYARLLGYPRGHVLEGRVRELAEMARQWYAAHGRPWIYARRAENVVIDDESVVIDRESFASRPLVRTLRQAKADGAVLVAVSAGGELEAQAAEAWRDEKPDEYFFLEVYGSAVVEHLTTLVGAQLCAWADGQALAVLPHYSPGYPQWDVADQPRLASLIQGRSRRAAASELEVLSSGMLRPKKSLLAVFGLTRHTARVRRLTALSPCENCCYANCQYRRAAYQGPPPYRLAEAPIRVNGALAVESTDAPLDPAARYSVNVKALERWARERLVLEYRDDGTIEARFRYEGTTCTNMGRPLAFDYTVQLGARRDGYPIEHQRCVPAHGDDGHRHMCQFLEEGPTLLGRIADDRPLAGANLDDILHWSRSVSAAGCYCDADSRQHKWGLVLETIHFALARYERPTATSVPGELSNP